MAAPSATQEHVAIRASALAALRRAQRAVEASARVVSRSAELRAEADALVRAAKAITARRLTLETELADRGVVEWRVVEERVAKDGTAVGRDPAIEAAKTLLAERYGLTRGEAFALLRGISVRRRVKVRNVARRVVAGAERDGAERLWPRRPPRPGCA